MANDGVLKETLPGIDRRALLERALAGGAGFAGAMLATMGSGLAAEPDHSGMSMAMRGTARKIITANNSKGLSYLVSADLVGKNDDLWHATVAEPLGHRAADESMAWLPSTAPGADPTPGGSIFRFGTLPPWDKSKPIRDGAGFHRTSSIDYVLMFSEILLVLDEGEVPLHPGDLVIQRNTNHAWRNLTNAPGMLLAVMFRPADK